MQHKLWLLENLVGAAEQRKRARNPKRLGSFEVKYQLDLDGLLDRQISRFVTFEAELLGVVAPSFPDAATARWYYSAAFVPGVFAREAILRRTMSM
jgi:hypothetical protein